MSLSSRRQHAIQRAFGLEARFLQSLQHFSRHVASAGQRVRRAGVVEQPPAAAHPAGQLVVERLRIQFAGDTETKSVSGIPILMNIPYLKYLFSQKTTQLTHKVGVLTVSVRILPEQF